VAKFRHICATKGGPPVSLAEVVAGTIKASPGEGRVRRKIPLPRD
jgi:hypothetical protein